MNEQLSGALVDVIKLGKDGVVNIALFAQQQAPDLAKQIISWGLWSNLFEVGVEVITIFVCLKIMLWALKQKGDSIDNPLAFVTKLASILLFCIMFICFFSSGEGFVKCLVAPKLYLIEYVKILIGK
jgi:hypothetical protein